MPDQNAERTKVKVSQTGDGLQIQFIGKHAAKYDAKLIEQCAGALIDCVETNGCLESGPKITAKCVETLVAHNKEAQCMTKGFGFAATRG
jgi:hypothetical protein